MRTQKLVELTDADVASIRDVSEEKGAMAGILQLWRILEPDFDNLSSVDPSAYALGKADWTRVFDALHRGPGSESPMFGGALAMELANIGPSQA